MRIALFLLSLVLAFPLSAQIESPDFLCTRTEAGEEVLRWDNTSAVCGPYQATEIFSATDLNGPFTRLVELTDPNLTEYRDPNPASELRYYFIRYRYYCPGLAVNNSDTLDNRIPATPIVQYAGVENGDIIIDWLASTSPEVNEYIILEVTNTAVTPIGSVMAPTTVFRLTSQAGDAPADERRFRLVSVDACGNDSPQGTIVSPMSLSLIGGMDCESTIQLITDQASRMNYLPATVLELFVSVNGGAFTSAGTAPPNTDMVSYRDANDGENLCFYVEAVLANNFGRARSVEVCQTVSLSQPVRDFPLFGAGFLPDGGLTLSYEEPAAPPVLDETQVRINRNSQLFEADLTGPVFNGSGRLEIGQPEGGLAEGEALSLRLTDACGREVITNEVVPVFLSGRSVFAGQNLLNWTPFVNNLAGTLTYTLHRAEVPDESMAATANYVPIAQGLTEQTYADADLSLTNGISCYRVEAIFSPAGNGVQRIHSFFSNTICVRPPTGVYLPTAFSPLSQEATNQVFRPYFSSPPSAGGYELLVFDRWGGLRFSSNDPAAGWPGTSQGQAAPTGVYLYQLRFEDEAGQPRQRSGTVTLIR